MHASEFARKRAKIERRAGGSTAFYRKAMGHLVREAQAVEIAIRGQVVGWELPDGGVVCAKIRYREEVAAQLELLRIAKFGQGKVPVRAYRCCYCGGFHLTSQAKDNRVPVAANDNRPAPGLSDERYLRK
jgi:hypothetical protein